VALLDPLYISALLKFFLKKNSLVFLHLEVMEVSVEKSLGSLFEISTSIFTYREIKVR